MEPGASTAPTQQPGTDRPPFPLWSCLGANLQCIASLTFNVNLYFRLALNYVIPISCARGWGIAALDKQLCAQGRA